MACPNLEDRAWDMCGMSLEELLDHYCKGNDRVVFSNNQAETSQFKDTPYHYMVVETNRLPGLRIVNIWDSREDE